MAKFKSFEQVDKFGIELIIAFTIGVLVIVVAHWIGG